ncbi:hypothetical protein BAUCODRAFT_59400, partial [Baudoinia panamericana UAMH 10762]
LPPPQLFDILPALHELLSRIDHAPTAATLADPGEESEIAYTGSQPLDPKDLPSAVLPIKAQIRKGLRELETLPDMDRSVEEQREEIAELETKIRRQEEVLRAME